MNAGRQYIVKILAVATILSMLSSLLIVGWLYRKTIEHEKLRLNRLARLYAQHLVLMGQRSPEWTEQTVAQEFYSDHFQKVIASLRDETSGPTDQIFLVRLQKNTLVEIPASFQHSPTLTSPLFLSSKDFPPHQFDNSNKTITLFDERNKVVLSSYEPLAGFPMGIVASRNTDVIQFPFLLAGGALCLLEMGVMLGVGYLFRTFATPAVRQLPKEEEKILAAVASAGEGIVTLGENGKIETFNKAAEEMFTCRASEMVGIPFSDLVVSSEKEACSLFLMTYDALEEKPLGGAVKEFNGQKKDGTIFPLTITLTVTPLSGHRLFTALMRDVTEQKMAERRLAAQYAVAKVLADCTTIQQATPEILRVVCESLGWQLGVLWQVEMDSRLLRCVEIWGASSRRFSEFVLVTQNLSFPQGVGLPGRTWETGNSIWIPDVVQDINFPRAPIASQAGLHAAFAFPIRLGEAIHGVMEFFSREIQKPDEALLHQMLSVGSQIGQFMQRKKTEMSLRESEEQIRLILNSALDAVVTLDQNGQIIGWNSQAERMFGWSQQEILGQPIVSTIIPQKFREAHLQGIQRCLASEVSEILNKRIELFGLHRDGHEFPLEIAITAIRSKGGTIFNGFIRDLTERRRTEEALIKSEEQLRQAQKMEAMGTLAGGIAHDFNNILSAIIGYTELAMAQAGVGKNVLSRLQEVLRASYRAKNLVRQILTFSRQESSGKKVVFLQPIVEEALALLRASLPSTITLHAELQSPSAPVLADATQIHQVVMNLGANAEYAMRASGGKLVVQLDEVTVNQSTASLAQGLTEGVYVRLRVSDSGQGIAPHIKKRIFDPFFTTKDVGEGTGMGLSVIHGVVTSHGGFIQVDSQEGTGTIFTIYFPVSSMPVTGQQIIPTLPSSFAKATIMFVDDEVSIVKWAKEMLEELGYMVMVFTNSLEALSVFKKSPNQFDVIVTDQTMPGMTGELFARQVLKIRPGIPIILCSGFSYSMNEEKALKMGLHAYLTKPVLKNDIARTLQSVLNQSIPQ